MASNGTVFIWGGPMKTALKAFNLDFIHMTLFLGFTVVFVRISISYMQIHRNTLKIVQLRLNLLYVRVIS
jgi:hypothetical protein